MSWNDLSMADRAKYIQLGVQNGITNLSIIRDTYNTYADGGIIHPNEVALDRAIKATKPATNYIDAVDKSLWNPLYSGRVLLDALGVERSGLSNCTLTVSQFYDPSRPIGSAKSIVTSPKEMGFQQIPEEYAGPGTMIIASEPGKSDEDNKYHTMIITGYADKNYTYNFKGKEYKVSKGDTLVSYSSGKNSPSNYKKNIPLKVYTDNSNGKTFNRYFNHLDSNGNKMILLPEVVVDSSN